MNVTSSQLRAFGRAPDGGYLPAVKPRKQRGTGAKSLAKARKLAAMVAPKVTFEIPLRTVNALNSREHWRVRSKRAADHRWIVADAIKMALPALPVVVTLTRLAPRMMDGDGAIASLKSCRDGVADAYGIDDADARIKFRYTDPPQEKTKGCGVRIVIERMMG